MRRLLAIVLACTAAPAAAGAQAVSGTLVNGPGATGNGSVMVALLDGAGRVVATAPAAADGTFTLSAPAAGVYRVRAERIGRATTLSAPVTLRAGETTALRMGAPGQGVQLEGIRVGATERGCVVNPRTGARTAAVWDEARKALSATRWSEVHGAGDFTVRRFRRELDATTSMVRSAEEDTATGRRAVPFRSLPPEELAREGYVRREGRENVFLAPDAQALLSDEFLDRHCFRVVQGKGRSAGMIGLAFEPVRGARLPDVAGTLWLDPASAELRYMDFRYTKVPGFAESDDWGGVVEFGPTQAGAWMVRRWTLRLPVVGRATDPMGRSIANARVGVVAIAEVGGEVMNGVGAWGDAPPAAGVVAGTVFDSTRAVPLAGAVVALAGTRHTAVSGPTGEFRMTGVPAGRYRVEFTHPRTDSLRWKPAPVEVQVASGESAVSLALPARALASLAPPRRDTLAVVHLPGVVGTAAAESRVLSSLGFYERRRRAIGTLWTGDEFREKGRGRITDHISGTRRIFALPAGMDGLLFLQRRDAGRCWVPVFLDGLPVPAQRLNDLRREDVVAVEIYEGTDVPGEFGSPSHYANQARLRACGAIVVWTVLAR